MNTTCFQPVRSIPNPNGSCTNFGWCVGGEKSSQDDYRTYRIKVFKFWYVYRRKPSWFGKFADDRYLGKLRWISSHADGKQSGGFTQRGSIDGWTVERECERTSDLVARQLTRAYGYIQPFYYPELHEQRKQSWYFLSIRCAVCKMTCAELRRKRDAYAWSLRWPKDGPVMDYWDAQQAAREHVGCRCSGGAA